MDIEFKRGYTVYKDSKDKNIMFVAPHSGPALASPVTRDDHSETVATRCWELIGGTLVVSSMTRDRLFGIDFNRYIPTIKNAIEHYEIFYSGNSSEKRYKYLKKYAWVAKDEADYYNRLQIYQNFWEDVCKGNVIIFVQKIATDYRNAVISETKRFVLDTLRIYEHFNPNEMSPGRREGIEKDLKKITKYADTIAINRLKQNFTPFNYLSAVENAVERSPLPCVTVEDVHDGSLALGPVKSRHEHPQQSHMAMESVQPR